MVLQCGAQEGPLQLGSIAARIAQLYLVDVLFSEVCRRDIDGAASAGSRWRTLWPKSIWAELTKQLEKNVENFLQSKKMENFFQKYIDKKKGRLYNLYNKIPKRNRILSKMRRTTE